MHRNKRCGKRILAALLSAMVMMGSFAGSTPVMETYAAEAAQTIPSTYSSVDLGYTPAVRSQGVFSNCWAHAALGSVEISMIKNKVAPAEEVDLSETHTVYYVYRPVADPLGGTAQDYTNVAGETVYTMFHTGNDISDTEEAFLGWMGPVSEADFYDYDYLVSNHNDVSRLDGLNDVEHAYGKRAATVVDSVVVSNKQEEMKKIIMDYGSVSISYNSNSAYFDYEHSSQYCGTSQSVTHAVTVVGWDDNFSKANFVTEPEGDGAWLVRNSWGAGHGINGYFWLSYYDKTINGAHGYRAVAPDKYDHNYRYDKGGTDNGYVNGVEGGNVEAANIFRIQNDKEILKAVQFGVQWINSNYSIQIYKNPTDASQPSSGEALLETPIQGTKALSGKYTVDLGQNIVLEKDDVIAVAVTYSTNNPDGCPAAQTGNVGVCNPGESMYRVNGGEWKDCAGPAGRNFVIRAFTSDVTEEAENHTHSWSEDWSGNALAHWHDCEGSSDCTHEAKDYAAHTGGTATCKNGAFCTTCGQEYGVKDGGNHEGSIVRKNASPATTTLKGYTGDLCCSGCNVILERGEEIPVLTGEEDNSGIKSVPNLDYTFYNLDGEPVSTKAEGRPKLLIFFGAGCGHCINTLTSLTSKKLEGVDIVAVDINQSSVAKIQELQLSLGVGMEDIQFCYDLGTDASGARIAYEKAFNGMTYLSVPVICYIDANNQIKQMTSGTQTLNQIKSNLAVYCNLKTTNLNKNNPSDATFTTLDGKEVSLTADGKPKVLVFFDPMQNSQNTLLSISDENIEGADIYALDIWNQDPETTKNFVDNYMQKDSGIQVIHDTNAIFEMFEYTNAVGENSFTYPVICYIDGNNKLQHYTMGESSLTELKLNLLANCGYQAPTVTPEPTETEVPTPTETEVPTPTPTEEVKPTPTEVPEVVHKEELINLIETTKKMDVSQYTDESILAVLLKLGAANTVVEKENATQKEVDDAIAALNEAVKALELKPTPTEVPTTEPTVEPTVEPTKEPTVEPTKEPTVEPTEEPTVEPTVDPTMEPTTEPTEEVTPTPTETEVPAPTETEVPQPTEDVKTVFTDVYKDWYTDYVQYVYDNGLMTGIKGTTEFQPNANITKAQVAQVLYNMDGQPEVEEKTVFTQLTDVFEAEWYADAVAWAYETGVVTGDTNVKKFFPNADVTREQLALMMYRYAAHKAYDVTASGDLTGLQNAENVSNWAADGVSWAVGKGLISGIEKNGVKDLAPQGNASRAQVAAILQRFCEAYAK